METIESLKRRVHTAEDLHSVVRTMKAMAAVNIRQLEHAVDSLAMYQRTIELGLHVVLQQHGDTSITSRVAPQDSFGAIVLGSDQGMCGQMNDQIAAFATPMIHQSSTTGNPHAAMALGVRVAARLEESGAEPETVLPMASTTAGITPLVQDVLVNIDRWHSERKIGRVSLFFCEHTSRAAYQVRQIELLPIDRRFLNQIKQQPWPTHVLPTFSVNAPQLLSALVRQYLFVSLYRACAESLASENAARLAAMRGAERNIGERIRELTGLYHQTRQMAITEELLDIVSGFEALESTGPQ